MNVTNRRGPRQTLELQPSESLLTDEIVQCGPDDGKKEVRLPSAPRDYAVRVVMAAGITGAPGKDDQLFLGFQDRDDDHRTQWEFLGPPDIVGLEFGDYRRQ